MPDAPHTVNPPSEGAAGNSSSLPPSWEQKRASHAWDVIEAIAGAGKHAPDGKPDSFAKDYARQAKKLPARIVASGLGQAAAFLYAKKSTESNERLLIDLARWLLVERKGLSENDIKPPESAVVRAIMGDIKAIAPDADFLRFATHEILAYLRWLNRFLEAKGWAKDDNDRDTDPTSE